MVSQRKSLPHHLKLAPQWLPPAYIGQSGLWLRDLDGDYIECSPEDAGLSEALGDRIEAWMDDFDALYDADSPEKSRFLTLDAYSTWREEGEAIAGLIRTAIGPGGLVELILPDGLEPL
jgi:hypothetical protein